MRTASIPAAVSVERRDMRSSWEKLQLPAAASRGANEFQGLRDEKLFQVSVQTSSPSRSRIVYPPIFSAAPELSVTTSTEPQLLDLIPSDWRTSFAHTFMVLHLRFLPQGLRSHTYPPLARSGERNRRLVHVGGEDREKCRPTSLRNHSVTV